jgi:hypothetical protein
MHTLPSVLARAAVVPVAIGLLASGCSGGGRPHVARAGAGTITGVAAATHAAGSGTAHGTVRNAANASGPLTSTWVQGATTALDNGRATFPVLLGSTVAGTAEIRWIGKSVYVGRAPLPSTPLRGSGLQGLFLRRPADRTFVTTSTLYSAVLTTPFSPARLTTVMAQKAANVRSRPGTANGSQTTEYYTVKPLPVVGPWPNASVSVWADKDDRVIQVKISSASGIVEYTVDGYTSQPAIVAPAASEIVAVTVPPAPHASGAYATVASGTSNNVNWSIQRAPGTTGTECWKWIAQPAVPVLNTTADGSRCYLAQQPDDSPSDATAFVVRSAPGGPYSAVAVRLPETVKTATLGFTGGKLQKLPAPTGKMLVWVGSPTPLPAYLGLTYADGTKVECFAGNLLAVSDLTDAKDSDVSAGDWSC